MTLPAVCPRLRGGAARYWQAMHTLEIFRAGRHVSASGEEIEFSAADLDAAARAYDPAKHEAPIVIGHPATDAPAYGWVKRLEHAGGILRAGADQVDPQFAELVRKGRFKHVSASFYRPGSKSNPVPGVYYLRHVGFLGAQPPAVKGLRPAAFAEGEDGVVEFSDFGLGETASVLRRLREWIIAKFSLEDADQAVPDYSISAIETAARGPDQSSSISSYSEKEKENRMKLEELAAREQKLREEQEALERRKAEQERAAAEFAEREKRLRDKEQAAMKRETEDFVERLVREGRVLPAFRDGLVAYLCGVPDAGVIEFGEGDKKQCVPAKDWLRDYLAKQPKIVEFAEIASGKAQDIPDDPAKIAERALEYQEEERKKGRVIALSDAVRHITGGSK